MKINRLFSVLLASVVLFAIFTFPVKAEDNIKVVLNSTELSFDVPPQLINGRTMVPMRKIFEALGTEVEWAEDTQTVYATRKTDTLVEVVSLKIDDLNMVISWYSTVEPPMLPGREVITLDVAPILVGGHTLVPARAIAEAFSCDVAWDGYNKRVIIRQETEIDLNDVDVQKIFNDTLAGDAFMCYGGWGNAMYVDTEMLDSENFNWMGGLYREIATLLSIKDGLNSKYTDAEANEIIQQFLSVGDIEDDRTQYGLDNLKNALENGEVFGDTATKERLVGVISGNEMDSYSKKLFGKPLPKLESRAYSIAYSSFFFYSRNNLANFITAQTPAIWCNAFYNEANGEYLFTRELESFSNYTDENIEPLKCDTKLLKATKLNDEISLWVYHESEYAEYSGGTNIYKGTYKNTYKKNGDNFYWISSYGIDE